MKRQKPWQDGCKDMRCVRGAGVDPHTADGPLAFTGSPFGLFEIGENTGGPFVESAALRRYLKLPGGPVEQTRPSRVSSRAMSLLTAEGVIFAAAAAREKPPSSTTRTKISISPARLISSRAMMTSSHK